MSMVARTVLERYGVQIPVFGMVKDSRHRTRAITADDREISISQSRRVFGAGNSGAG